ncbi:MAG: hypothetical protein ABR571_07905 [Jatrophihabitans sp.]|uniref:hypothetical protein n=1 Tax=Jatrophihabitans sp. TaxID=1932789 RepID=UPI0039155872
MTADLETAVRSMLRERAHDIDTVPADFEDLASLDVLDLDARHRFDRRNHPNPWLIAAAVAAVLAVIGTAVAFRGGDSRRSPATTQSPSPLHSSAPAPSPTGHARRSISLSWFGMKSIAGFAEHARASEPGYRWLAVRGRTDTGVPVGCNGCESASAYIYVLDKGRFTRASSVRAWTEVSVGGRTGYLGSMPSYPDGRHELPTLAWEFRPGEWALVQGVTAIGSTRDALVRIAAAVEPARSVPIELPFRLDYVPSLPITAIEDDRSEGYAFTMDFGSSDGVSMNITLWNQKTLAGRYDSSNAIPQTIGGLPGYFSTNEGAAVRYATGLALISVSGIDNTMVGEPQSRVDAQTRLLMTRIVNGVHWTNGTGRAPYLAAEKAIP